jgi:hypothetical protein
MLRYNTIIHIISNTGFVLIVHLKKIETILNQVKQCKIVSYTELIRIPLSKEKHSRHLLTVIINIKCMRHTGKGLDIRTAVKEGEFMIAVENSGVLGPILRCP